MSVPGTCTAANCDRPRSGPIGRAVAPLILLCVLLGVWNTPVQPLWGRVMLIPGAALSTALTPLRLSTAPADPRQPRVVLLVGSDSREGIRQWFGHLTGGRADSVMLVEMIPALHRVQILSLSRDLQVDIAGHGLQKLNAALGYGGPMGLVEAVRRLTRLPIHHYVELDFSAVALAVDALGGVTLEFPRRARDLVTGFQARQGPQHLDGQMAVAFARSRRYEELRDGLWTPTDASDLGRIRRQQRLLLALRRDRLPGILELAGAWQRLGSHVRFDSRLSLGEIWRLLGAVTSWPADERNLRTLPTRPAIDPAEAVSPFPPLHLGAVVLVHPEEPAASTVIEAFRRGDLLSPAPSPEGSGAP